MPAEGAHRNIPNSTAAHRDAASGNHLAAACPVTHESRRHVVLAVLAIFYGFANLGSVLPVRQTGGAGPVSGPRSAVTGVIAA